jgi:hypothetical protein
VGDRRRTACVQAQKRSLLLSLQQQSPALQVEVSTAANAARGARRRSANGSSRTQSERTCAVARPQDARAMMARVGARAAEQACITAAGASWWCAVHVNGKRNLAGLTTDGHRADNDAALVWRQNVRAASTALQGAHAGGRAKEGRELSSAQQCR